MDSCEEISVLGLEVEKCLQLLGLVLQPLKFSRFPWWSELCRYTELMLESRLGQCCRLWTCFVIIELRLSFPQDCDCCDETTAANVDHATFRRCRSVGHLETVDVSDEVGLD
ncbi:hypothetical protein Salat_0430200 [Sesamum alatum]|uniref:Uncharacterized protein n=1 Tax=Sesamum alatum TaxID=300844 RepID=A0AAE1Z3W4_9LAMI|nr:hypothetical protein Salat_0430200 [Sesamum alatum]